MFINPTQLAVLAALPPSSGTYSGFHQIAQRAVRIPFGDDLDDVAVEVIQERWVQRMRSYQKWERAILSDGNIVRFDFDTQEWVPASIMAGTTATGYLY